MRQYNRDEKSLFRIWNYVPKGLTTYNIYSDSNPEAVLDEIKRCLGINGNQFQIKSSLSYINKIQLKIIFYYFDEIERGFSIQEHLAPLIVRLDKRIDDLEKIIEVKNQNLGKVLTIVSLRDVNTNMKKIFPLLICKQLYDEKKKENCKEKYLNLIIDEAHNILSESSERESKAWKDYRLETFEEIIKEGRKFCVFLTLASQRPSDISPTIISQLHNFFIHRLINDFDIKSIQESVSYLDKVSFESISILPTGTCVMAGLLAQVPIVVDIEMITPEKHEPDNKTIILTKNWQ